MRRIAISAANYAHGRLRTRIQVILRNTAMLPVCCSILTAQCVQDNFYTAGHAEFVERGKA